MFTVRGRGSARINQVREVARGSTGTGSPKRANSTNKLHEWHSDRGGEGSKSPEILWTSFKYCP